MDSNGTNTAYCPTMYPNGMYNATVNLEYPDLCGVSTFVRNTSDLVDISAKLKENLSFENDLPPNATINLGNIYICCVYMYIDIYL